MAATAIWVMIATFWGDAVLSQEFTSYENCMQAGEKMREAKNSQFIFICSEK
jgi:hypothetical protein